MCYKKNIKSVIVILGLLLIGFTYSFAKGDGFSKKQNCSTIKSFVTLLGFNMYGDPLLNWYKINSLQEVVSQYRYEVNVSTSVPADDYCVFTGWSQKITWSNHGDLSNNTINNITIPQGDKPTLSIQIKSGCVFDVWTGNNVYIQWSKTMKIRDIPFKNFDMGWGQKLMCPTSALIGTREYIEHQKRINLMIKKMIKLKLLQY